MTYNPIRVSKFLGWRGRSGELLWVTRFCPVSQRTKEERKDRKGEGQGGRTEVKTEKPHERLVGFGFHVALLLVSFLLHYIFSVF